jgi:hypothetical protein
LIFEHEKQFFDPIADGLTTQKEKDDYDQLKARQAAIERRKDAKAKAGQDIIDWKFKQHKDKMLEVFERYSRKAGTDGQILLKQLPDVFADVTYLCNMVFCDYQEYMKRYSDKSTSDSFRNDFEQFIWRYIHDSNAKREPSGVPIIKQEGSD